MPHVRSPQRLDARRSALWVIDIQEKLCAVIRSSDNVIRETERLIEAAGVLGVPAAATVQYPAGLGPLVPPLQKHLPTPEEKRDFSAAVCRRALDQWFAEGRDQIVIAGMETHVCVLQSVLDLIAEGAQPFVVAEAVASQDGEDHETAIDRMRDCGATIVTAESVMFEWLSSSTHPEFKTISRIVKSR